MFDIEVCTDMEKGQVVTFSYENADILCKEGLPRCRVGDVIAAESDSLFKVVSVRWSPCINNMSKKEILLEVLWPSVDSGSKVKCEVQRSGYSLAWITMSDKGAAGQRTDEAGPLVGEMTGNVLELCHEQGFVLPDEVHDLQALLVDLALTQRFDLIMTTGGTGLSPRDITPEGTLKVVERRLSGIEHAMTATSLAKTPHAVISRAVAGSLGSSIIINLPGSPKAVKECLEPVLPALRHAVDKLQGDPSDCAGLQL